MSTWDDPVTKWDAPLVNWGGDTTLVTTVPTWDSANSTWDDPGEGWSGERGDLLWPVPPGMYVKHPSAKANMLQVSVVTQGLPSQPTTDLGLYMRLVVPPGHENDTIEYDLLPYTCIPWHVRANRGTCSVSAGDDGQTATPPGAWFSAGSVYLRQGNIIWRYLWAPEITYTVRARLGVNSDWVDVTHIVGRTEPQPTALTIGSVLPTGMERVWSNSPANVGPRARNPSGVTKDSTLVARSDRTVWRRCGVPTVTFPASSGDINSFTVRSNPFGGKVWGYVHWQTGANFVISTFGPVPDNTVVLTSMCTIIDNWDTAWIGRQVNQISGWGGGYWQLVAGYTFSVEAFTLLGTGTPTDPYQQSAQGFVSYTP